MPHSDDVSLIAQLVAKGYTVLTPVIDSPAAVKTSGMMYPTTGDIMLNGTGMNGPALYNLAHLSTWGGQEGEESGYEWLSSFFGALVVLEGADQIASQARQAFYDTDEDSETFGELKNKKQLAKNAKKHGYEDIVLGASAAKQYAEASIQKTTDRAFGRVSLLGSIILNTIKGSHKFYRRSLYAVVEAYLTNESGVELGGRDLTNLENLIRESLDIRTEVGYGGAGDLGVIIRDALEGRGPGT